MVKKEKSQFEEYKYAIIVIGSSILIAIILLFIVAIPLWKDLSKNSGTLKNYKEELTMLEDKLANLKELSNKEAQLKTDNAKVLAALPEDKDISRLFVQFENVANQSGIVVTQVTESKTANSTGTNDTGQAGSITPVIYKVTAMATDYASLKNALANFEKALRIVSISEFDVALNNSSLGINFTVTTYKRSTQ